MICVGSGRSGLTENQAEDCAYQVVITTPDPYGVFGDSGTNDLAACKGFVSSA